MSRSHTSGRDGSAHAPPRPRYPRIAVLIASLGLTFTTVAAAALDVVPYSADTVAQASMASRADVDPSSAEDPAQPGESGLFVLAAPQLEPPVRSGTGNGRRVVFDMSDQRVWLVRRNGDVLRTYLVSGSLTDNLQAGRFAVYSRSRHATGFTGSTTMDYMVRFTTGERAAIGFHDIPTDARGRPVQGVDELGTPTSAGCIRQRTRDAKAMWAFAQEGTRVVVVD